MKKQITTHKIYGETRPQWGLTVICELEGLLSITASDAQGIIIKSNVIEESWNRGCAALETAKKIAEDEAAL